MKFQDAIDLLVEEKRASLAERSRLGPVNDQKTTFQFAKKFGRMWGDRGVDQIGRGEVLRYLNERRQTVAQATIQHELAFLSRVFSLALEVNRDREELGLEPVHRLKANPISGMRKRFGKSPIQTRWLTDPEREALRKVMHPEDYWVMRFLELTGLRMLEAFGLRGSDIRREEEVVIVRRGKNGRARAVPLCSAALSIGVVFRDAHGVDQWLFYPEYRDRSRLVDYWRERKWKPAARKAGVKLTPRHLRHTCASRMVQKGVSLYQVQAILGHTTPQMTMRYAHLNDQALRSAVQVLS